MNKFVLFCWFSFIWVKKMSWCNEALSRPCEILTVVPSDMRHSLNSSSKKCRANNPCECIFLSQGVWTCWIFFCLIGFFLWWGFLIGWLVGLVWVFLLFWYNIVGVILHTFRFFLPSHLKSQWTVLIAGLTKPGENF